MPKIDGSVDAKDYDAWKANFGATGEGDNGGPAMPVPGAIAHLALGSLLISLFRFKRRVL